MARSDRNIYEKRSWWICKRCCRSHNQRQLTQRRPVPVSTGSMQLESWNTMSGREYFLEIELHYSGWGIRAWDCFIYIRYRYSNRSTQAWKCFRHTRFRYSNRSTQAWGALCTSDFAIPAEEPKSWGTSCTSDSAIRAGRSSLGVVSGISSSADSVGASIDKDATQVLFWRSGLNRSLQSMMSTCSLIVGGVLDSHNPPN